MRLIDADAVRQKIQLERYDYLHTSELTYTGLTIAKKIIEEAPTIEAEPVVHGRWEDHYIEHYAWGRCSNCGCVQFARTRYCPNCGAKMDRERKCDG